MKKYQISIVLITISFPKKDKDLKNWFLVSTIKALVEINIHPVEIRFFTITDSIYKDFETNRMPQTLSDTKKPERVLVDLPL